MSLQLSDLKIDKKLHPPYYQMQNSHFHSDYELYYLISGTRKYIINHNFYSLKANDMILISKGEIHRTTYITEAPHERIVLYFNENWLQDAYQKFGRELITRCLVTHQRTIFAKDQPQFESLLNKMLHEFSDQDEYSNILLQNYFDELLILLIRSYKIAKNNASQIETVSDIIKAANYICDHYRDDFTLKEIADYVNLSPTYFSKKFKETTGLGFKEYVIQIRINEAATQLVTTKDSITMIALRCGFNDSNYFGDLFRKVMNMSPREFRKNVTY